MSIAVMTRRTVAALLLVSLAAATSGARADSWQDKFYRAYYLETAKRDLSGAVRLYEEVAGAARAENELRVQARARAQACREELASADFARLMPPDTLIYAELNQPGEKLAELARSLGLLAEDDQPASAGQARFAISPALISELVGLRGAAVAVTGFDPINQKPTFVGVLHPGNLEVLRGLIETALPVTSEPVRPIAGFPTYSVEGEMLVTLTNRLIIASPQRGLIVNVVRRLKGESDKSLATSAALAEVLEGRQDALLFFCVNAKPIMPMLNAMLAAGGTQSRELAAAQAVLDLNSIRSLSGRAGIGDAGLFLDVTLRLDRGHHNLVYNLLRLPPLDRDTLRCVPRGAAGFFAAALNEPGSSPLPRTPADTTPVVTGLDFGRELFANIIGVAVYALPPNGEAPLGGPPIPDVAAAITVHDPSKSEALWTQMLGIASLAAGTGATEGAPVEIEGTPVRSYEFPDGVTVYFGTLDNTLLISLSESAMARSLVARRSGESIMDDPAFASSLARLGPDSTIAIFVHPGRCAQIAKRFAPPAETAAMEPWLDVLDETVASAVVTHSGEMFRFSAMVSGIPDIGDLVTQLIANEQREKQLARLMRAGKWDAALKQVDALLAAQASPNIDLLSKKFRILAVGRRDRAAAAAVGAQILEAGRDAARRLNNLAWALLTESAYEGQYDELALRLAQRANETSGSSVWQYVDTLAWAKFKTGDARAAVELEQKALSLCDDEADTAELQEALTRFETALDQSANAAELRG